MNHLIFITVFMVFLIMEIGSTSEGFATEPVQKKTGVDIKKPVFGGACKTCPWGAMAIAVKDAMTPYGYDVQICYNCSTAEAPRIVAEAKMPPPVEKAWAYYPHLKDQIPPPPNGPVDFGAVAVKFLRDAYRGTGVYSGEKPRTHLRLIATIRSATYFLVAVRSDLEITDLSQLKKKKWPATFLFGFAEELGDVLDYYGLSKEEILKAGGKIQSRAMVSREKSEMDFDVIMGEGTLTTAPEFSFWNEISQRVDLTFLELPDDLLSAIAKKHERERVTIPYGLLPGVYRRIPTTAISGIAIYGRSDLPDDFAYDVAKALDEQQDVFLWAQQQFLYNRHNVWKAADIPLHPGAERYYREVGFIK